MLKVIQVPGEPTRFRVESNSVECDKLPEKHVFNKRLTGLLPCQRCPKCRGLLRQRFHFVDIAANNGVGQCDCEFWRFTIAKRMKTTPKDRWVSPKMRCHHVEAARQWALDLAVGLYRKENHAEQEESAP